MNADRFFINQRVRPMVNQYEVYELGGSGTDITQRGPMVCFVQQKRVALKEDLRAYTNDTKTSELFRIKARRVFDPSASYTVTDEAGQPIGALQKAFKKSLLRSTWKIHSNTGQVGWAQERSAPVALLRRFGGMIPFVGGIVGMIPLPYHFDFYAGESQQMIGSLTRKWGIRDRYILDLTDDSSRVIDRRLAIALAVGLDALQAR